MDRKNCIEKSVAWWIGSKCRGGLRGLFMICEEAFEFANLEIQTLTVCEKELLKNKFLKLEN